jgi:hypothetical protein
VRNLQGTGRHIERCSLLRRNCALEPGWVAAQFWATLLIVLAGSGVDAPARKHAWQVGLTLLLPLLMLGRDARARSRNHARFSERRRRCGLRGARSRFWSGSRWSGLRGSSWTGATIRFRSGRVSELARLGARAGQGLHLRAHSILAHVLEWIFAGLWCRRR